MSQTVFFHYRTPIESIRYNKLSSLLYESCVISGFHLVPSTTHEYGVDITRGTDNISGAIFQNGAAVMETSLEIESLALDDPHPSYKRMDAVVIEYVHGYGTTSGTYKIVKGSEHPTEFLKPSINQYQVPLGYVEIHPGATVIQQKNLVETVRGLTLRNQSGKSNLVKLSGKDKGYITGLDIGNYRYDIENDKIYATLTPGSMAISGVMTELKASTEIELFSAPIGESSIWVVAEFNLDSNTTSALPTLKAITTGDFDSTCHLLLYKYNLPTWSSIPDEDTWVDYIASPSKFLDFRNANALFGGQGLLTMEYLGITNGDFLVPDGYDVTVTKNPAGGWDYTVGVGRCYIGMSEFIHDSKVLQAGDNEGSDRWDLIYVNKDSTYVDVLEAYDFGLFDKNRHLPIAWVRIPAEATDGEETEIIYSSFTPKTIVDSQEEMYAVLQWLSILEVQTLNTLLQNEQLQSYCDSLEARVTALEAKINA